MRERGSVYYRQVQFLVQIFPLIFTREMFALKGGTAINLFYRDLPRLSVDIDLAYLGREPRTEALHTIRAVLDEIAETIEKRMSGVVVQKSYENKEDALRLVVQRADVNVKIELSPVLRGIAFQVQQKAICPRAEDEFGFVEVPVLSMGDLYGGKICAALDRQHPRDFFDIWLLLKNEGITEEIRKGTLVYLLSHRKPLSDLLNPKLKELKRVFQNEFEGMSEQPIELEELDF